jgi:hypothetical protein
MTMMKAAQNLSLTILDVHVDFVLCLSVGFSVDHSTNSMRTDSKANVAARRINLRVGICWGLE